MVTTLSTLCILVLVLRWWNDKLNRENKRLLPGMGEVEKEEWKNRVEFADETDRKNPFFKYTH